jgi:hypothetical protein
LRKWWNWQTHHLEGVAPKRRAGSSPAFRTILFLSKFLKAKVLKGNAVS